MSQRNYISEEEVIEIKAVRKKNRDKAIDKRLEVLLLHAEGKKREEISAKTGYGRQYVTDLVCIYRKKGLEHFSQKHYKGNHRNLSFDEEETLLEPFKAQAEAGEIVEVGDILAAYEAKIGRSAGSNSQIYYVLRRHGWRKVMPRSKHPKKASEEAIDASKKLTLPSETRWQILPKEESG